LEEVVLEEEVVLVGKASTDGVAVVVMVAANRGKEAKAVDLAEEGTREEGEVAKWAVAVKLGAEMGSAERKPQAQAAKACRDTKSQSMVWVSIPA
jgi:hypothetical protein